MAEHDYTPGKKTAVSPVTLPTNVIQFPDVRSRWDDPEFVELALEGAAQIPAEALLRTASATLTAPYAQPPDHFTDLRRAFMAFLCLARALDDAGMCVAEVTGGAA